MDRRNPIPSCLAILWLTANCGARSNLDTNAVAVAATWGGAQPNVGGASSALTTANTVTGAGGSWGTSSTPPATGGAVAQPRAVAISAGSFHTCALLDNATVHCWGSNEYGRLGNGTYADSVVPTEVVGITTAIGIYAGGQHSCAWLSNDTVRCWGSNDFGQLGDGTLFSSPLPVPVNGLSNVTSLTTGYQHSCAIVGGTSTWCWGANEQGQVGNPLSTSVSSPTEIEGTGALLAIAAGRFHTCAIQDSATQSLTCWGSNAQSQLGATTPSAFSTSPVRVGSVTRAKAIAAGSQHNCAVVQISTEANEVLCWGWSFYGQLGNGSTDTTMGSAIGIATATSVSAADHSCARQQDGHLMCWGFNRSGQLGNGSTQDSNIPVGVVGIDDAVAVSAAATHSCALLASGQLKCWGDNANGQLGDGSTVGSTVPVSVVGF